MRAATLASWDENYKALLCESCSEEAIKPSWAGSKHLQNLYLKKLSIKNIQRTLKLNNRKTDNPI